MSRVAKSLVTCASAALALACANLAVAAGPPTTYNAHTDLNTYNNPYPTLPNWGGQTGAGTIIKDPSFGCPILRATDWNSGRIAGRPMYVPASSEARNWNTVSSFFHVSDSGGTYYVYSFNTSTMAATKVGIAGETLHDFDATNANICYGHTGTQLNEFNCSTMTAGAALVDFQTKTTYPLNGRIADDLHVSRTGGPIASVLCGGTAENTDFLVFAYNIGTGTFHTLDLKALTIDGVAFTPIGSIPTMLHNASIAPGGGYICLDPGDGTNNLAIWDIANAKVYQIVTQPGGHKVFGYGPDENAAFVNSGTNIAKNNETWLIRKLPSNLINTTNDLVEHPSTDPQRFDANGLSYDYHASWNNSRSNASQPVFADTYHIASDTGDPHCCWGDEVIAIGTALSSGNTVYRFAQPRSKQNLYSGVTNFYDTPRGTVSQDGMYFMFNSNYQDSLGTDPATSKFRSDVFIIHLDQSATH